MNDEKINISDMINKFKIEHGITDTEKEQLTDTKSDSNNCEPVASFVLQEIECTDNCSTESPSDNENSHQSIIKAMKNIYTGNTGCIGRYVQLPNNPSYGCIGYDINYTPILFFNNQPLATISFENSQFIVYQNNRRCGIVYGEPNEIVWRFIPDNMPIPPIKHNNISPQSIQTNDNTKRNIILNNVPADKLETTYDFINKSSPSDNIYINFANPNNSVFQNKVKSPDIIDTIPD